MKHLKPVSPAKADVWDDLENELAQLLNDRMQYLSGWLDGQKNQKDL